MIIDVKLKDNTVELISDRDGWLGLISLDLLSDSFIQYNESNQCSAFIDEKNFYFSKEAFI